MASLVERDRSWIRTIGRYVLTLEKGIRSKIYLAIHWYSKAKSKYMNDYDLPKNCQWIVLAGEKIPLGLMKMLSKLWWKYRHKIHTWRPLGLVKMLSKHDENIVIGYTLEVYVEYLNQLHGANNALAFLPERMRIKK